MQTMTPNPSPNYPNDQVIDKTQNQQNVDTLREYGKYGNLVIYQIIRVKKPDYCINNGCMGQYGLGWVDVTLDITA